MPLKVVPGCGASRVGRPPRGNARGGGKGWSHGVANALYIARQTRAAEAGEACEALRAERVEEPIYKESY